MDIIKVEEKEKYENGWLFEVEVGEGEHKTFHQVKLTGSYYEELTDKLLKPEELVLNSFRFLLAREPKEKIVKEFYLFEIQKYFPEYEKEMKRIVAG